MTTSVEQKVNGHAVASPEPRFDPVALAEAEAIRTEAAAKAEAIRAEAQAKAEAEKILAIEKAEKERISNERAAMRLEKDKVDHAAYVAKKEAEAAEHAAKKERAETAAAETEAQEKKHAKKQQRSESWWRWGARGIYTVGLIIAAPVQFMHFWDPKRPFLIAAPALLEGFALVLAFGAAWAVAHRRDVAPYRVGIMLGAAIAAGINLYGGLSDDRIGFNAGLIGAIASLGGPLVLMAYEHGIAQKADGIPSWRERRAADKEAAEKAAAEEKARTEKEAADAKAAADKKIAQEQAEAEQQRRDNDRRNGHADVWEVADALLAARGSQYVTEQIWGEAWLLVTGCSKVGIRAEIEEQSRAAQARMRTVTDAPVLGSMLLVNSQRPPRAKRDPDAPDGRRNNGGTPPVRRPGVSAPNHPIARAQARAERTAEDTRPNDN